MAFGRRFVFASIAIVSLVAAATGALSAEAAGAYPSTSHGFDISFPQCGSALPTTAFEFAIIGVNHGRPYTQNDCLAAEFGWARQATAVAPSLHMNLSYPTGSTGSQGLTSTLGTCARSDKLCQARNYGYNAASYALNYAGTQGAASQNWWLDIETANLWSKDVTLNAAVIGGALTYFQAQKVTAGIYSTAYQWGKIAGSYAPGVPIWIAGAADASQAQEFCGDTTKRFAGGTPLLVQYVTTVDEDYAC